MVNAAVQKFREEDRSFKVGGAMYIVYLPIIIVSLEEE